MSTENKDETHVSNVPFNEDLNQAYLEEMMERDREADYKALWRVGLLGIIGGLALLTLLGMVTYGIVNLYAK